MTLARRAFLSLTLATCAASGAGAHSLYTQWVVYRRKHLLIGCHREDLRTWSLARDVVAALGHALPEAEARAARAPGPQRLASLLATDQMSVAVLSRDDVAGMQAGTGRFAPYGPIPLRLMADFEAYALVAHAEFPRRHGLIVASALSMTGLLPPPEGPAEPWHPGVLAFFDGEQP